MRNGSFSSQTRDADFGIFEISGPDESFDLDRLVWRAVVNGSDLEAGPPIVQPAGTPLAYEGSGGVLPNFIKALSTVEGTVNRWYNMNDRFFEGVDNADSLDDTG